MKTKFDSILFFILSVIFSMIAFYAVYRYTDQLFQKQKFPYPFELFGIAAGLGTAFWVYAAAGFIRRFFRKIRRPSSGSPYSVEEKVKADHVNILPR